MDGYTFLARMQEEPALASIPVIVTTQSDGESDEVTALSARSHRLCGKRL
ncbi:MAG: hypothetical protein ACLTW9_30765 [Enterocloster sp.]